ncbi:MAG TPA: amino acid permease, partial [Pseudohongiella sp.]|nr:amino acid permease [Pseudohongiella sp.]
SGGLQNWFTLIKVGLILGFVTLVTLSVDTPQPLSLLPSDSDLGVLTSSAFAVSLIYVNYAYTGWNAATYITSEVDDPARSVPRVLILGTAVVILLYLA